MVWAYAPLWVLLLAFALGIDPQDEEVEIPKNLQDRLFSGSTQGPMAAYFRGNRTATESLLGLKKHMQDVEERLHSLFKSKKPYGRGPDDYVCNRPARTSIMPLTVKLRDLGLPPIEQNCTTEIDMKYDRREQAALWQDRVAFDDATRLAGLEAVRVMKRADWKGKAYPHARFGYVDHIDSCQLIHNVGFRVRGVWAVMVSLTQYPVFIHRGERRRQYMVEYLTSVDGVAGNVPLQLTKIGTDGQIVRNSTTTWENWAGRPGSSIFRGHRPPAENPAIAAALQAKDDWRQQVEDSRTASNISILTLSCLISLIPLGSFADVSMLALLIYTIATDIVSCIPLSIKGIELLQANRQHYTTVVWAFGGLRPSTQYSLVVESWSAICETKSDVRNTGLGLLLFALVLMSVGVILEIFASSRMKRRNSLLHAEHLRENNERLKQHWSRFMPCQNCDCYDARLSHANIPSLRKST